MKFFRNYDEPSVGLDLGHVSLLLWYGSVKDWKLVCQRVIAQDTHWRLTIGPLTFFWWTY